MSDQHDFCRATLKTARQEARANKIALPKRITALLSNATGRSPYFIEADGVKGEHYYGDCTFDVKAKYIYDLIEGKLKLEKAVTQQ